MLLFVAFVVAAVVGAGTARCAYKTVRHVAKKTTKQNTGKKQRQQQQEQQQEQQEGASKEGKAKSK